MLSKLDECIEYVSSHVSQTLATVFQYSRSHLHYPHISCFQPHFKDYPVYLSKFKQCLSRAMLLIRSHAVSTLQNLTAQLSRRVRVISAQPMIRSQMIVWFLLCLLNVTRAGPAGRSERRQRLHALLCEVQSSGTQSPGKTPSTPDRLLHNSIISNDIHIIIYIVIFNVVIFLLLSCLFQRLIEQVEQRSDRIPEWVMRMFWLFLLIHFYAHA